jgi:hypothetical protein
MKATKLPPGISFYRQKGMYRAQCKVRGRVQHAGYFHCPFNAYVAYLLIKREELNRELTASRKLKSFFVKSIVDTRFQQLESVGFQTIRRYLNEREGLS